MSEIVLFLDLCGPFTFYMTIDVHKYHIILRRLLIKGSFVTENYTKCSVLEKVLKL